jgi:prepilin-type N-terminal cleavage/methylation domain-containing protein
MKRNAGISLIELITAIAIIGVLAGLLAPVARTSLNAYFGARNSVASIDALRYAMDRIEYELRDLTLPITTINPVASPTSSLGFNRTDSVIGPTTVTLAKSGTSLNLSYVLSSSTVTGPLLTNVSSFAVKCYDRTFAEQTCTQATARFLSISLTTYDPDVTSKTYSMNSWIALRN